MDRLKTTEIAAAIPQLEVMSAALVISLILLGTPVQSVEDSSDIQQLRKHVEVLESRIAEHEARAESFTDILSSQRSTFGWGITLITILATVLFGVVGWGIFEWRASYIRDDLKERTDKMRDNINTKINEMGEDVKGYIANNEDRIIEITDELKEIEDRLAEVGIEKLRDTLTYLEDKSLHVSYVDTGLGLILKILDYESNNIGHMLLIHNIFDKIKNKIKNKLDCVDEDTYEGIVGRFEKIIDRLDEGERGEVINLLSIFRDEVEVKE